MDTSTLREWLSESLMNNNHNHLVAIANQIGTREQQDWGYTEIPTLLLIIADLTKDESLSRLVHQKLRGEVPAE